MMWYDVLTFLILAFAAIRGAVKGIVWQLAVIGAIVLCFAFAGPLSLAAAPYVPVEPPLNRWLAMLGLYLLFTFGSFVAARSLREMIEKAKFEEYDKHVGAVFGLVKGVTFCLVLTFFIVTISEKMRGQIMQSYSGYAAAVIMDRLHPVMPDGVHEVLEPYIHQLDQPSMDLRHSTAEGHRHSATHGSGSPTGLHGRGHDPDAETVADTLAREGGAAVASGQAALDKFVSSLPGVFDEELRASVRQALDNTQPQDRSELMEKLRSGVPGLIRMLSEKWKNGKPADGDQTSATERTLLLNEISAVYAEFPDARETIAEGIEADLSGLPDQIILPVLRDWHADLYAIQPDPDPETDLDSPLDTRIVRQLAQARIPLTNLGAQLRERLRESLLR